MSFSSEDSKPDSCGFVFPEFFLEKQTQFLSYPNSTQWRVKKPLLHTPPVHIIGPIMSKLHQRRAEEKCLFCFASTLWEPESVPTLHFGWTNCFGGPWGVQEPNLLGAFDNRGSLLAGLSAAELQEEPLQCGFFWICTVHGSSRMAKLWDWRTQGTLSACTAMTEEARLCW